MVVEVRILGPISMAVDGAEVDLGDRKQRILLGILAYECRLVPRERLIQLLWEDGRYPQDPEGQLYSYFSRVRKAVERVSPEGGRVLKTSRSLGYELELDKSNVDYHRFRRYAAQAKAARARDPEAAARLGRAALAEWNNPAGVRGGTPLEVVEPQLERILEGLRQEYQAALMTYQHAELACGRHEQLLPELAVLAGYDEYGAENQELARIRMLAIYRAGNKSDALEIYQRLHDLLDEKFNSEPDMETKNLKKQILTDDPALRLRSTDDVPLEDPAPASVDQVAGAAEKPKEGPRATFVNHLYGDKNEIFQAESMTFHRRDDT